ncbi:hypothetical protein P879_02807 [Paragonimus westermani]|uniref:Nicotinic acetylcholine receptor, invertebrate n=1 Tax=Paragonimus westermani TaxID=34504 RepID=A0A8T0DEF6_9TREM|nr:hypothetical protein P879_02807 [Paragonimus westermani]
MLLNRYEQYGVIGRPVNDSKIKVYVDYGLQLFQILDLDENKQILRTNCWSMYTWNDSLLQWNESEYGGIKSVRIFPSQIWTPDIKLYNFADERLIEQREARVVISSNGNTLWVPQALFKSTCEVEITYFPFDTQICMLEFGSWTYDKDQLDLSWWRGQPPTEPMPYVDFSDYVPSNEWRTDGEVDVISGNTGKKTQIRSVKKLRFRTQTIGNETVTREFPVLRYLIRLRRNPNFYVLMLVIPCVLLSSLTLVVFWLPPESPAKMMLGMNIFVAFFVLLLLLAESTPSAVRKFPLIGIYFCLNMIMITLSTFLATLVIHLYFRGDRNGAVPAFLRRFIIDGIGRLVFVRQHIPLPDVKKPTSQNARREIGASAKLRRKPHLSSQVGNKFLVNGLWFGENGPRVGVGVPCYPTGYPMYADSMFDGRLGPPFGSLGPPLTGLNHETSFFDPCSGNTRIYREDFGVSPKVQPDGIDHLNKPSVGYQSMSKQAPFEHEDNRIDKDPNGASSTATLESDVREVKRYVKMFVNHKKEIQRKGLIAMEWRTLAIVLDRLFFFLYITTIGIAVIVSVPGSTEPELSDDFRE